MMMPARIWTSSSAATARKYFQIRFWLSVSGRKVASYAEKSVTA
jgi:hypothetical protein